jgi:ligand-binding sensor domain-containing protein/putative methionine-R-sulfoxide reductase with GAF domain
LFDCSKKVCVLLISAWFVFMPEPGAQSLSFHHLNTADGLSENSVSSLAIDQKGFLWIGTVDGLNIFDGYQVLSYKKEKYPQLASNNIAHLTCDSRNRIWLGTSEGVTWIDNSRRFHRVLLNDTVEKFGCKTVMDTKQYGPVLYTSLGQFFLNSDHKWEKLDWIPESISYNKFLDAYPFDENKIIWTTYRGVYILDYATKSVSFEYPYTQHPVSVCRINDNEIAVGLMNGRVEILNIHTKQLKRSYALSNDINGVVMNTSLTEVRPAANGNLLVATGIAGLVIIDSTGKLIQQTHNPIDSRTIAANNTYRVLGGAKGEIVVGTSSSGLSIGNIYKRQAGLTTVFKDDKGNLFDNYITEIATSRNNVLWIGAYDRLIRLDRKNDRVQFFHYYFKRPHTFRSLEIKTLCVDAFDKVWVGPTFDGVAVLNEADGTFKKIAPDTSQGYALRSSVVNDLLSASDGHIWVATSMGVYTIDARTHRTEGFKNHPLLRVMEGKRVNTLFEDGRQRIWIGVQDEGLHCYDQVSNTLNKLDESTGLAANNIVSLMEDSKQNIYIATVAGFNILHPDGSLDTYDKQKGLRYTKVEGFLEDELGYVWIANNKCLVRFDPVKKSMRFFDEAAGISASGFNPGSYAKTYTGELVWGSRGGINYFYTGQLSAHRTQLQVNTFQADIRDSVVHMGSDYKLTLPYAKSSIVFHFTAIDLMGSKNIQYQYMLQGYDKEWQNGTDILHARYTSLPSGEYTFLLRARADENSWVNSSNKISVSITPPIWQRWWFIGGAVALIVGFVYSFISSRNKKIEEQREEIEMEQAINYFASSMSEQQTEENILWDVAKNCIGRLQFEDCVIYLHDEERDVLVQKAAHGPKSPRQYEISRPIEIKPGQGIVGSVAQNGRAEIIPDTTKDPRYLIDDEQRFSEITVPIIYDGKVLGVIDCEHSRKKFFTQKHLSILTTIASLCANKIVRARAEEEKREAQMILMSTQQKMTEVEMQALRAQMNPHFIFNCLNSINRYIVKSDQTTASLYLTKFAKLIRLILDNSNSKNVILTNELEALKLYIEMEALRFDKKFTYEIQVEPNLGTDTVEVPPLIIQPYVENAIWHGLLHKEGNGHLSIKVSMAGESMLQCIIEDNGVGREKAKTLKSKTATSRKSLGMQLTENRLNLLNKHAELNASIQIIDLENSTEPLGTRVILKIPV